MISNIIVLIIISNISGISGGISINSEQKKKLDFLLVSLPEVHISLSESEINSVVFADGEISVHPQMLNSNMFSVLITSLVHICLLVNGSTIGKLRQDASANYSSKDNPPRVMQQTFKINNWGFDNSDRQILIELKQKIDSLHGENEKCNRGNICCLRKIKADNFISVDLCQDITKLLLNSTCINLCFVFDFRVHSHCNESTSRMDSLWKFSFPDNQCANSKMERCPQNLSDARWRPPHNQIRC